MSTRAKPLSAPTAGMDAAWHPDGGYRARGYEPVGLGLVVLAVDAPATAVVWDGLPVLLDHLYEEGLPCVVTTPASRSELAGFLERLACTVRLPMRICAEDVPEDSPWPTATLLACNRLAIQVRHALVIADGPRGTVGGAAADCLVIGLGNASTQAALRRTGANFGVEHPGRLVPIADWAGLDGRRPPR